jgi:hypothetical protein
VSTATAPDVSSPPMPAEVRLPGVHLLAKPSGSTCNIDCTYCFFLSKEALYPNDRQRMSQATLEAYIRQLLESHRTPQVTVAWQGGEPTLMKLDFFRNAIELVERYRQPGQTVQHTFQTNGLLLDDDGCAFFKAHDFLVGLSVDGPRELHDTYRVDRRGQGTFDRVMRGWRVPRKHEVDFNILCTVNAANQQHGRAVYRFFRDELGAKWVQFIPIIERATELEAFFGRHQLCIHAPTCGYGPALEHNGDPYRGVRPSTQVRPGQARHPDGAVPRLQGPQRVQRRLSEGPFCAVARRRAGPQRSVCGVGALLHPHRADLQRDGAVAAAEPSARRRDGLGRRERCEGRGLSAVPLRQRREVPLLPRRQGAGLALQRGRS